MKGLINEFKWPVFLVVLISGLIVWTYFVFSPSPNIDYQVQLRLEHQKEQVLRDHVIRKLTNSGNGNLDRNQKDCLNMLFEQWNTILKQEHALFRSEQSSAQQNIAIWLSIIAAICTILPIVIGINQNMSFNSQVNLLSAEFQRKMDEYSKEIRIKTDRFNNEISEFRKKALEGRFSEQVNTFSVNLRILTELEEIEIHQNVLLTCPKLLKGQLDKLEKHSLKFKEDYLKLSSEFGNDVDTQEKSEKEKVSPDIQIIESQLRENLVDVYILMNNLLKKYETYFDDDLLFRVHDTMDQLWYKTNSILNTPNEVNIQEHIESICHYISRIKEIFYELLKRKNAK
jgi:hypothetical protein